MYNLFVSGNDESWNGEPWDIELSRCVREYTDEKLTARFGDLSAAQVNALRRFPCIFAYELGCQKDPHFGVIRDVVTRQNKARIEYDIIPLNKFPSWIELRELAFELDTSKWELNRSHWALKDINLARELHSEGITLPVGKNHS